MYRGKVKHTVGGVFGPCFGEAVKQTSCLRVRLRRDVFLPQKHCFGVILRCSSDRPDYAWESEGEVKSGHFDGLGGGGSLSLVDPCLTLVDPCGPLSPPCHPLLTPEISLVTPTSY